MKRYSKPNTDLGEVFKPAAEAPEDPPISDISIIGLLDDGLLVLYREMRNLKMQSVNGKLDSASSRDLRDTVKLLFELYDREQDLLKGKTDEELDGSIKQDRAASGEGEES